jgi:hypothetical protein
MLVIAALAAFNTASTMGGENYIDISMACEFAVLF